MPAIKELCTEGVAPPAMPLLAQVETTVSLIYQILTGSHSGGQYAAAQAGESAGSTQFVPGALSNPEHVRLPLRGCFRRRLCYVAYTALFWPGMATSVTTCSLTARRPFGVDRALQPSSLLFRSTGCRRLYLVNLQESKFQTSLVVTLERSPPWCFRSLRSWPFAERTIILSSRKGSLGRFSGSASYRFH
jgi:hypothetical protein